MASTMLRTPEPAPPPLKNGTASAKKQATGVRKAAAAPPPSPAAPKDEELEDDLELSGAAAFEAEANVTLSRKPDEFFTQLAEFTTDDWQYLIAYLYRTAPTIDRRSNGRAINLRKYVDYFDTDRILREHGSGGYRIDLNRRNPVTGKCPRIGQVFIDLLDMDYPPRVPIGDWIDEPENNIWKWAKPSLEAATVSGHFPGQGEQIDPNKVFDTVLSGVERLSNRGNSGDGVAAATIKQFGDMVTTLLARPAAAPDTSMITFLQNEVAASRAESRELRQLIMTQQNQKQPGILEQLKEIVPVVKDAMGVLGINRGAGGRPVETNCGDVANKVVEGLNDNLPILYEMFRSREANAAGSGIAGGFRLGAAKKAEPATAAAAAPQQTQSQPINEQASDPVKQQEAALADETRKRYQAILGKWGKLIDSCGVFIMDYYRRNKTGYELRDWFIEVHGMNNYGAFRADVSADDLAGLTQLHSLLQPVFQPPDKVLVFMTEFLTLPGDEPAGTVTEE